MSKLNFLAEICPKTAIFAGPGKFFSKKFFFRKNFFCSIFKIKSFWAKKCKKKIFSQIPLYSDPGLYLRKIFRIFLIFSNKLFFFQFFQLEMVWNDFQWLPLCSGSFLLELNGQKRSGFLKIWPEMAQKLAKYAKIKVFDPLIKIDLYVSPGNNFKWLLLYFTLCFVMLDDRKGPEYAQN